MQEGTLIVRGMEGVDKVCDTAWTNDATWDRVVVLLRRQGSTATASSGE